MPKIEFQRFKSIERWDPEACKLEIYEKIDGTNAQILITEEGEVRFGSRSQFINPLGDNFGFAKHFWERKEELIKVLGPGFHYGEWFGRAIQRTYHMGKRKLALFYRINPELGELPDDICVVPKLYSGPFNEKVIQDQAKELKEAGSVLVPGFMRPEGLVLRYLGATYKVIVNPCKGSKKEIDPNKPVRPHPLSFGISRLLCEHRLGSVLSKDSSLSGLKNIGRVSMLYFEDVINELGPQDELEIKLAKKQFFHWYKEIFIGSDLEDKCR